MPQNYLESAKEFGGRGQAPSKPNYLESAKEFGGRGEIPVGATLPTPTPENKPITEVVPPGTLPRIGRNLAIGAAGVFGGEALAPVLAPALSQVPGLSGVTSETLTGPLSSITMAAINSLFKRNPSLSDVATDAVANEVGRVGTEAIAKIPSKVISAYHEYTQPGSIVNPILQKLGATYSQYTNSSLAKFIEDTFAPGAKREAFQASQQKAKDIIDAKLTQILENPTTSEEYKIAAGLVKDKSKSNYLASMAVSTARGNTATQIAQDMSNTLILNPQTSHLTAGTPKVVNGPSYLENAITHAKSIVDEITPSITTDALQHIITDPKYNQMQQVAAKILLNTDAKFSGAGQIISHTPVSFANAWQYQKDLGNYISNLDISKPTVVSKRLRDLYGAIGDDITNSIPKWNNQQTAPLALRAWNDSKAIAKERIESFFPDTGLQPGEIALAGNKNVSDQVLKYLDDNHAVAKMLVSGQLPRAVFTGAPIQNIRRELATLKVGDMFESAKTQQGADIKYDITKFFNDFNDSKFAQTEDPSIRPTRNLLLSNGQQDDIRRFATALGNIQEGKGLSNYIKLRTGFGVASATGGLLTGMVTGNAWHGLMTGGGVLAIGLTGNQLAKTLINQNMARIMVAASEGQPLGMPARAVARIAGQALKGEVVKVYNDKTGDSMDGIVQADGQIVPKENK